MTNRGVGAMRKSWSQCSLGIHTKFPRIRQRMAPLHFFRLNFHDFCFEFENLWFFKKFKNNSKETSSRNSKKYRLGVPESGSDHYRKPTLYKTKNPYMPADSWTSLWKNSCLNIKIVLLNVVDTVLVKNK